MRNMIDRNDRVLEATILFGGEYETYRSTDINTKAMDVWYDGQGNFAFLRVAYDDNTYTNYFGSIVSITFEGDPTL